MFLFTEVPQIVADCSASKEVVWTLVDGLVGAVAGGVISAVMTIRSERKRSKTEIALHFVEQFMSQYDDLALVKGILIRPSSLSDPDNMNKVRKFGDWCEIVAATCLLGEANGALLTRIGIPAEMRSFYKAAEGCKELGDTEGGWKNLYKFVTGGM